MRTFSFLLFAFLATTFFIPQPAVLTDQEAELHGTVIDDTGEPMIGATIKILKDGKLVRGAISDYEGNYRASKIEPGTYTLIASYTGYEKYMVDKLVLKPGVNRHDISMKSGTVLNEVVVTNYNVPLVEDDASARGEKETQEEVLEIPTKSIPGRKVDEIVATTAGSSSVDGGAVNIKGSRSNETNYYIDGIRVYGTPPPKDKDGRRQTRPKKSPKPKVKKSEEKLTSVTTGASNSKPKSKPITKPEPVKQPAPVNKPAPPKKQPDHTPEHYSEIVENEFKEAHETPVSTFSIDVDGASYANARRFINRDQMPPPNAVRVEEFINYFDYQYEQPTGKHPFSIHTEYAKCPWNKDSKLLMIGLQGREISDGQLPPSNFVFLVDVSGSMSSADKLPLVQRSMKMLTDHLRPQDRVALVVYAGSAGEVLPSTSGTKKTEIKAAIDRLRSGGSTAGGAGIQLAYNIARKHYISGGNNRVILCTDGDFNVGVSSQAGLVKLIEKERESGVYLSVLGFGTGNYQDSKMQMLSNKGNGNHAYIDRPEEAQKVLVDEFAGTLFAIAKDVKIQIEFDPARVGSYRLIGYENRMLKKEDFDDDTKDAGELGAGHRVTALYEIIPAQQGPETTLLPPSNIQLQQGNSPSLGTIKFRYKPPKKKAASSLIVQQIPDVLRKTQSANFQLASGVAAFGLVLRNSKYKGKANFDMAKKLVQGSLSHDPMGYRSDLVALINRTKVLSKRSVSSK